MKLTRAKFTEFLATSEKGVMFMEACGSSNFWARRAKKFYPHASQDVAKGHNSPDGVWDQQALAKNQALNGKLDDFAAGKPSSGQSVKNLDVSGKSPEQLHHELTQKGFEHKRELLNGTDANGNPVKTPHDIYTHRDGGMVRVKPEGYPGNKIRPEPHVSKSVLQDPNGGTGWNNEAFKVTNEDSLGRRSWSRHHKGRGTYYSEPPSPRRVF